MITKAQLKECYRGRGDRYIVQSIFLAATELKRRHDEYANQKNCQKDCPYRRPLSRGKRDNKR